MALDIVEGIYNRLLTSISSTPKTNDGSDHLTPLVRSALSEISQGSASKSSSEIRRMQWEFLIRRDVFKHAALEGDALSLSSKSVDSERYYSKLKDWLDLALVFTELGATDPSYTFLVIQDLLETQTIPSCSRIFDWIELRSKLSPNSSSSASLPDDSGSGQGELGRGRLTQGMVPQKGKALVLLRTLNELLRRLSKAGQKTIGFSGRILAFLSQVFPLGERSGVNLRGDYGPTWDLSVDERREKDEFYQTFWSLQLPFSKPSVFALRNLSFAQFQDAVDKVLPVIKEATAKERALMGAGRSTAGAGTTTMAMASAGLKRKRGDGGGIGDEGGNSETEYFFAKFLTSPELLDLEIADTHFRRQFLFQLLILLTHLLTFTKAAKANWMMPKNRSLHMPFFGGAGSTVEWSLDDALTLEASSSAASNPTATSTGSNVKVTAAEMGKYKDGKDKETKDAKDAKDAKDSKDATAKKPDQSQADNYASKSIPPSSSINPSSNPPNTATAPSDSPDRIDPIRWTNLTIQRTLEEIRQTQPPSLVLPNPNFVSDSTSPASGSGSAGNASSSASPSSLPTLSGLSGLSGRHFAETVQVMLEREKGWIKWKNELCDAKVFERGRWEVEDELLASLEALERKEKLGKLEEVDREGYGEKEGRESGMTGAVWEDKMEAVSDEDEEEQRKKRRKMTMTMYEATRSLRQNGQNKVIDDWKWDLGTEALTEIWAMGYRELDDLERGFSPGSPRDFLRQLELEERRIEMRTRTLRVQQERRAQMERAAKEKMEKAERDTKEKEEKEKGADSSDVKSDIEMKTEPQSGDVEMKPPSAEENASSSTTQPVPQTKTEPIPVPVSSVHPSLPPKPGSRPTSPLKVEQQASNAPSPAPTSAPPGTTLAQAPAPAPATPTLPPLPPDEQIRKAEESKTLISWLALRTARDSTQGHLVHFGKIGTGDVKLLVSEIEKAEAKEREEKEKMAIDQVESDKEKLEETKPEMEGTGVQDGDVKME